MLSGALTGILVVTFLGRVWSGEDLRPFAVVFCFVVAFFAGASSISEVQHEPRGAFSRIVSLAYWSSFVICGVSALSVWLWQ